VIVILNNGLEEVHITTTHPHTQHHQGDQGRGIPNMQANEDCNSLQWAGGDWG